MDVVPVFDFVSEKRLKKASCMACSSAPTADFVQSLSREEIECFNGAELYKIIEFVVIHELKVVTENSPANVVREAVLEWCAGALNDWDILENSPWFYRHDYEKPFMRRFIAQQRRKVTADRRVRSARVAEEELQQLSTLTEAELAEFFED